jgi:hypothetical protein
MGARKRGSGRKDDDVCFWPEEQEVEEGPVASDLPSRRGLHSDPQLLLDICWARYLQV